MSESKGIPTDSVCTAGDGAAIDCRHCGAPPGVTCADFKAQVALSNEVIDEVIAEEQAQRPSEACPYAHRHSQLRDDTACVCGYRTNEAETGKEPAWAKLWLDVHVGPHDPKAGIALDLLVPPRSETPEADLAFRAGWSAAFDAFCSEPDEGPKTADQALAMWHASKSGGKR